MIKTNKKNIIILIFFTFYLLIGLKNVTNYGISFDEEGNRLYGLVNGNYILKNFLSEDRYNLIFNNITSEQFSEKIKIKQPTPLHEFADRAYGVIFELPVTAIEILLNFDHNYDVYVYRHLMTFLFFFLSMIIFYLLLKKIFKNIYISLLGPIFLISNPRIFADSFYNSKDIVFLSFFLITFYFAYSYLKKNKIKNLILLAFFSACSINLRAIAVVIPLMVYIDILLKSYQKKIFKKELIFFPVLSILFLYIIWPLLWEDPINNFIYVINWFKEIPIKIQNFYLGSNHDALNAPWHYLFVWILNTTPFFYLILMIAGIPIFLFTKIKYFNLSLVFIYTLLIPIFLVFFFNIALYDGWRHFYFITPFLTILCLITIDNLIKYKINKLIKFFIIIVLISSFSKNIYDIKKLHPYQNLYFNYLFVSNPYELFEKDYWGLTNRIVLENFYEKIKNKKIIYAHHATIITKTSDFLNKYNKREFQYFEEVNDLNKGPLYYFVLNRYHPPYDLIKKKSKTIYEYKIDNTIINGVYEFKNINDFINFRK